MAGSMFWQNYVSDNGNTYAIFTDKSNCLAVNASASANSTGLVAIELPRGITPRYALFRSDDGKTQRKVPILKQSDLAALTPGKSFDTDPGGDTVRLTYVHGEKIRFPKVVDTGKTT